MRTCLLALLLAAGSALPASAEDPIIQPGTDLWRDAFDPPFTKPAEVPKDTPLRKQLFDLLRPKIEREAKRKVQFEGSLRAFKNWALFSGETVDADGKSVKFPPMDNTDTVALWLRTREGWRLVDHSTGHSDAFYIIWHEQYGAPKALVGLE
ncbi:hypothetical protein [Brevifollis gellanilyticus]|uniref:Nuclear transport factor 2 family protein n=1 Tax=Brevifollis gellanilyticus TaxID=748831 RepID=A0A512MB03_9BACT|nr:hypothetical protein [Brevifollis gellanilyticus]GEP43898.1 hypothetical protein BGE01nite_31890 [Brevifollis gellanilyticus]